jgi:hypothetical protein
MTPARVPVAFAGAARVSKIKRSAAQVRASSLRAVTLGGALGVGQGRT